MKRKFIKQLSIVIILSFYSYFTSFSQKNNKYNPLHDEFSSVHFIGRIKSVQDSKELVIVHYDTAGSEIERTYYLDFKFTKAKSKYTYEKLYHANGCIKEIKTRINVKSLSADSSFLYEVKIFNQKGNIIETNTPLISVKYTYRYDLNDRLVEDSEYRNNILNSTHRYHYDEIGRQISVIWASEGKFGRSWTYKYDSIGRRIQIVTKNSSEYQDTFTYVYDDFGNDIETYVTPSGDIEKYQYEYDDNNNWIKLTKYINGKVEYVRERKFEYY